jgi:hypothetical protein
MEVGMRHVVGFLAGVLVSAISAAQTANIPVSNWTVPPYAESNSGGLTTMTDATPPRAFIGVQPCRIVDTRVGFGFSGAYGPPALSPGVARSFDLINGPCPGLPSSVDAYSLNITAVVPAGPGHLIIWPTGGSQPNVSSINYTTGQTIANAVIVPAGAISGAISVVAGGNGTNLLIDINGYFSRFWSDSTTSFEVFHSGPLPAAHIHNGTSACSGPCGLRVTQNSTSSGRAIAGEAGINAGNNSAGVFGVTGGCPVASSYESVGVRGEGCGAGVVGIARVVGTSGSVADVNGNVLVEGYLGYNPSLSATNYGVWSTANYGGGGAKFFVEPHPTDASKVIRYISLEGNEPGTYFRGRGRFERGIARVPVPEDFRLVSDADGLTVQITPIGAMASFAVLKADLNEIVAQSSRNVEFYYLVQGIRRTHKHLTSPIGAGTEYMPKSADAKMPPYLTEGQKQLLVQNGTYRADGSVNLETAYRLGWDRVWADRGRPRPEPDR